jgi:hypothetical protein
MTPAQLNETIMDIQHVSSMHKRIAIILNAEDEGHTAIYDIPDFNTVQALRMTKTGCLKIPYNGYMVYVPPESIAFIKFYSN